MEIEGKERYSETKESGMSTTGMACGRGSNDEKDADKIQTR
jgi:hypothetical protein